MKPHRKNPNIAKVFTQMGIVEELGSGTRKIFEYTPIYSNGKQAQIEEEDVYRVTIPYQPTHQGRNKEDSQEGGLKSGLKETEKRIVSLIEENPYISYNDIAEQLEMARSGIAKHIKELQEKGIIRRIGPDKGGHWEVIE